MKKFFKYIGISAILCVLCFITLKKCSQTVEHTEIINGERLSTVNSTTSNGLESFVEIEIGGFEVGGKGMIPIDKEKGLYLNEVELRPDYTGPRYIYMKSKSIKKANNAPQFVVNFIESELWWAKLASSTKFTSIRKYPDKPYTEAVAGSGSKAAYGWMGSPENAEEAARKAAQMFWTKYNKDKRGKRADFIRDHLHIAILEYGMWGIPPSITIVQAALESGNGQSTLARKANNFFGVKERRKDAKGYWIEDDKYVKSKKTGKWVLVKSKFRVYKSKWFSFRDHSNVLRQPRYKKCFDIPISEYEDWCECIHKAGYATDPKYAESLKNIIRTHNLQILDRTMEMLEEQNKD